MSGRYPRLGNGPETYQVSVAVVGGQLVEPDGTTGKVKPTAALSKKVLGVALTDANPAGGGGGSPLQVHYAQPDVAVARGVQVKLTSTGAVAFGELIAAAANGAVQAIGANTFDTAIGRCETPAGLAGAGTGLFRLF